MNLNADVIPRQFHLY